MTTATTIDLAFPLTTANVPIDHGYLLYAGLSKLLPVVHEADWLGVHPLQGRRVGETVLMITRGATLKLRIPPARIPELLALSGKELRIGGSAVQLGPPSILPIEPTPSLFARRVAIRFTAPKKCQDGALDTVALRASFEAELTRQMNVLGVRGRPTTLERKTLRIKGQTIVAFSVQVDDLTLGDSLALQAAGLGGKRKMGCGVFCPTRKHRTGPNDADS